MAAPAAMPPTTTISIPPRRPCHTRFRPYHPSTAHVRTYPNRNNANAMTTILSLSPSATPSGVEGTKKYGVSGMSPPRRYPVAMVSAETAGLRDAEESASASEDASAPCLARRRRSTRASAGAAARWFARASKASAGIAEAAGPARRERNAVAAEWAGSSWASWAHSARVSRYEALLGKESCQHRPLRDVRSRGS